MCYTAVTKVRNYAIVYCLFKRVCNLNVEGHQRVHLFVCS